MTLRIEKRIGELFVAYSVRLPRGASGAQREAALRMLNRMVAEVWSAKQSEVTP